MKRPFLLSLWMGLVLCGLGCRRTTSPPPRLPSAPPVTPPLDTSVPLPKAITEAQRSTAILQSLRKRLLGRSESLRDVERVVTQVGPIVAEAARLPEIEEPLRQMAAEQGKEVEAMRAEWIALQEADLLLEAGGSTEAVSSANAVGVAQWLAGTARAQGLPVQEAESQRLTAEIAERRRQLAWLEYLAQPDSDARLLGAPALSRTEAATRIPLRRAELERLKARRRRLDGRYDPRQAIFAQTRYLLRLYPRYPSPAWLFQAYHGGEGGVNKTLRLALGDAWPGSAAHAIRYGNQGGPLSYETLYHTLSPQTHPAAFAYLYGRSDDHRYYWWKLRTAQEIIALYRRDPAAFRAEWQALLPGEPKSTLWYASMPKETLPRLRTATRGTQALIRARYGEVGGTEPLVFGDWSQAPLLPSPPVAPAFSRPWPPPRPVTASPSPAPSVPDLHVAGIAFDIRRPTSPQQRKLLEYVLDRLSNQEIIWTQDRRESTVRHYHIVPHPRHADALAQVVGGAGEKGSTE